MIKNFFTLFAVFISTTNVAQNVGIGEPSPTEMQLQVKRSDSAILLLHNPTNIGLTNKTGLFFKTNTNYSGSIATIGSAATFRMGFFTFGGSSPSSLLERISILDGGNVGIGTTTPGAKLEINGSLKITGGSPGAGKYLISDNTGLASWSDLSASLLPGGINGNTLRHNGADWVSNSLIYNNGSAIGIGTSAPAYILDVNGRARLRHNGSTSGIWYNKADNTEASFVGMLNDTTYGFFGNGNWRVGVDVKNGFMGIGITDPAVPLSFPAAIGKKISLYPGATGDVGFGVYGNELRINSDNSNADITLGYDNFISGFTERMRVKGNGNVGIGTNAPTLAGLVVNKVVGNTNALFGANTTGVSVQSNFPGIGFNVYYSGGNYHLANGGAGYIGVNPTNSRIILSNTGGLGTAGAPASLQDKMWIEADGTVSLGSSNLNAENTSLGSGYKLKVYGKIISEEVRVQLKGAWPDYVFESGYKKLSINELERFVKNNMHLPNIPSAKDVEKDGQQLGEIQVKMLEKIEELSLYIIELNKRIIEMEKKQSVSTSKN